MIAAAEKIRRTHPAPRVSSLCGAAERLASIEDKLGTLYSAWGAFEHMPDKTALLAEVRRVLKPHGVSYAHAEWRLPVDRRLARCCGTGQAPEQ